MTGSLLVLAAAGLVYLMSTTRTGFVPNEDMGTIYIDLRTPPGTNMASTSRVMDEVESRIADLPQIEAYSSTTGSGTISGQGSTNGMFTIRLKDWSERTGKGDDIDSVIAEIRRRTSDISSAEITIFTRPMIPGYGTTSGFEVHVQDRKGGDIDDLKTITDDFIAALNRRPEIGSASTSFDTKYPQYLVEVNAARCIRNGVSPGDVLDVISAYVGGSYASNLNLFSKLYRVMVQAEFSERTNLESLNKIKVKNGNEMAPITQFMTIKRVYGPDNINRFNMYTSMAITGNPADGYSSGQAIQAVEEVAAKYLPTGYGYEYSGMTREEQSTSGSATAIIFVLCFVFIYLLLSAQYESYLLPLAVILSIPFGLAGSFIFIQLLGAASNILPFLGAASNDIYMQIALIMLIGLLAKNAILITEFALDRRKMGMSITWAAVLGAGARLRPIMMTSLAMIVGLLPLLFAMGAGANGNRSLGATAVGGMLIGVICQIFVVPSLFVIFQYLQEKIRPMVWEDIDNTDAKEDIEQYSK